MHDLIVVGAGTAGCVLAERLTAAGDLRVLLVEAGGAPDHRFVTIPAAFAKLFRSRLDWALESEPQVAAGGRRVFTPRGKMLGGTSNLNAQIHQWCHPADFDGWAAAGATGWSWSDVAPTLRAQERWLGDEADPGRGREGPMFVSPNRDVRAITRAFVAAARSVGLGDSPHYNGGAYRGAWLAELAHRDGRRFSVYDAYLKPALRRANLESLPNAHAVRVDVERGRAAGVRVRIAGEERKLPACGVVLAAGVFGSPHLLWHSGFGPAEKLAALGLPVLHDVPDVGENLQDHPLLPLVFRARGTDTLKSAESPLQLARYLLFRSGMLASNGVEALAFTNLDSPAAPPDLELIFAPLEWRNQALEAPSVHAFSVGVAVVAPRSRGSLRWRDPDPLQPPAIDFGLLTDREGADARALWAGVALARRIAATEPLRADNAGELRPGEQARSEDDLLAYAAAELQTVYHPTSTCRMGSDERSVVDPELRVRGVDGLWVADASVFPSVPRGHPNAVVAMVAERAAARIAAAARA